MRFNRAEAAGSIRRKLALSLIAATAASFVPGAWHDDASAASAIGIYLDGQKLSSEAPPYILPKVNVTMVPLRIVSEGLGATVDWSAKEKTARISMSGSVITLKMGQNFAVVNGANISLDASVETKQSRTMVPLRFVGEQLGLSVDWNAASRKISLSSPAGPGAGGEPGTGAGNQPDAGTGTQPGTGTGSEPGTGTGTQPGTGTGSQPGTGSGSQPGGGTVVPGPGLQAPLRGAWVSTVYNLDWPSTASYKDGARQRREYVQLLDDLQRLGMNAAFVQVRPSGDALYPSLLVPWSSYLTGKQGLAPDYDPLAFMIEETHRRGMEFHAWFNPFRASTTSDTTKLDSGSIMLQHPEWIVNSGGKPYINPGIPAARQSIIDAIMEVVARYDIDGVHLDDYFYPSGSSFDDEAVYRLYSAGSLKGKADWRRDNINAFVRQLSESIHAQKPAVRFGISPFGVWRNKSADPEGSDTKAGTSTYDGMYADVRLWVRQGWLDYVAPQIYWSFAHPTAPYEKVAEWWTTTVKGTGVDLYIGHSPYKLGTTEAGWQSASEIIRQLDYDQLTGSVTGELFFSAKDLRRNPLGVGDALSSYYSSAKK
ncbi:family 10 glycosylhydrolase [Paenibacillus sp. D51F]